MSQLPMSNEPLPPVQPDPYDRLTPKSDRARVRRYRSADLLQGQVEVHIEHGNDTYRLRLTRSGKLILQK